MQDPAIRNFINTSNVFSFPGGSASAVGGGLPTSSHTGDDKGASPLHPDSPIFWLLILTGGVLAGIIGLGGSARVGPAKVGLEVGKS
jgi:hypothetical protein